MSSFWYFFLISFFTIFLIFIGVVIIKGIEELVDFIKK